MVATCWVFRTVPALREYDQQYVANMILGTFASATALLVRFKRSPANRPDDAAKKGSAAPGLPPDES